MGTPDFHSKPTYSRRIHIAISFLFLIVLGLALHQALHEDRIRVIVKTEKTTGSPGSTATRPSLGPSNKNEITGSPPGSTVTPPGLGPSNQNDGGNERVVKETKWTICPGPSVKFPYCSCTSKVGEGVMAGCSGHGVEQWQIDQFLETIRSLNNLTNKEYIDLNQFYLRNTNLTTLDLDHFMGIRISVLDLKGNYHLNRIRPPSTPFDVARGFIQATEFVIAHSPLDDQGFGNTLNHFDPDTMTSLSIYGCEITGSTSTNTIFGDDNKSLGDKATEFFPGLSAFKNLIVLYLYANKIRQIGGGQFRQNTKLKQLSLSANRIVEIGENAFDFVAEEAQQSRKTGEEEEKVLLISVDSNQVTNARFHANHGLDRIKNRSVRLDLWYNRFETIEEAKFENFLKANPKNELYLTRNPIKCDNRLQWVKDRWSSPARLKTLICKMNSTFFDTIYETNLVPYYPPPERTFSKSSTKEMYMDKCPNATKILPCTCLELVSYRPLVYLACSGGDVTQSNVDRLFKAVRYANNVRSWLDPWIVIHEFGLSSTNLKSLDMTPLVKVKATWISISDNKLLENMTSPFEPIEENGGFINASKLTIRNTPCFNNSWANNMLKYFVSPSVTHLILDSSGISDSSISVIEDWSGGLEFVPGLSRFTNLTSLSLEGNHISKLPGGILSRHSKLEYLNLRNNGMEKMDKYSLFFNGSKMEGDDGNQSVTLVIDLSDNNLTNENLAMDLGLGGIRRTTLLMLGGNPLETLEREMFEKFLRNNNSLSLTRDPKIVCDRKVAWLREGIQEFRNRVKISDCSNDVGKNVFNSRYSL